MATRRNQSKAANGVGLARDRFVYAERIENGAAFGRHRAATRLIARKVRSIDNDDTADAELPEMHSGREASGPGADDAHIGMYNRGTVVSGALRFSHGCPELSAHSHISLTAVTAPATARPRTIPWGTLARSLQRARAVGIGVGNP